MVMGVHRAFALSAVSGMNRWRSLVKDSKDLGMDAFQYRTEDEEAGTTQRVESRSAYAMQISYADTYRDVPVTGGNQMAGKGDRAATLRELLPDLGLPEGSPNFSGDVSELRGYLRRWLGLCE